MGNRARPDRYRARPEEAALMTSTSQANELGRGRDMREQDWLCAGVSRSAGHWPRPPVGKTGLALRRLRAGKTWGFLVYLSGYSVEAYGQTWAVAICSNSVE